MHPPGTPARTGPLWRVFPWDRGAPPGQPYSVTFIPPVGGQTGGRFDLGEVPVLYFAETPEHALAEILRRFAGKPLRRGHLRRRDRRQPGTFHPLALVEASIPQGFFTNLPDLVNPSALVELGIRPDHLASEDRRVTQAIARSIHERGHPGFRWWSALKGEWHATVLYLDRVPVDSIEYGPPDPLDLGHPVVTRVRDELRMLRTGMR